MANHQQKSIDTEKVSSVTGYWKQRTSAEKILFVLMLSLLIGSSIAITILVTAYLRLESRLSATHSKASVTDDLEGRTLITIATNTTRNQVFSPHSIPQFNTSTRGLVQYRSKFVLKKKTISDDLTDQISYNFFHHTVSRLL